MFWAVQTAINLAQNKIHYKAGQTHYKTYIHLKNCFQSKNRFAKSQASLLCAGVPCNYCSLPPKRQHSRAFLKSVLSLPAIFSCKLIINMFASKKNAIGRGVNFKNTPGCCRESGNIYNYKATWRVAGEPAVLKFVPRLIAFFFICINVFIMCLPCIFF